MKIIIAERFSIGEWVTTICRDCGDIAIISAHKGRLLNEKVETLIRKGYHVLEDSRKDSRANLEALQGHVVQLVWLPKEHRSTMEGADGADGDKPRDLR